jgi:preprotein translocase subunit YajC
MRHYSIILAVTGLWFMIWRSAKREDQKRLKKYESVLICSTCRVTL